jgi:hypothetical protein
MHSPTAFSFVNLVPLKEPVHGLQRSGRRERAMQRFHLDRNSNALPTEHQKKGCTGRATAAGGAATGPKV